MLLYRLLILPKLCNIEVMAACCQAVLEYHGCDCCQKSRAFNLTVDASFSRSGGDIVHLTLKMCFQ